MTGLASILEVDSAVRRNTRVNLTPMEDEDGPRSG